MIDAIFMITIVWLLCIELFANVIIDYCKTTSSLIIKWNEFDKRYEIFPTVLSKMK